MRKLRLALVAGLISLGLAACGDSGGARLAIYSGRTSNLIRPLLERFSKETGIKIDVRYADSAELALLIHEEGDKSPADVFISQSPGAIGYLDAQGRLRELDSSVLDRVSSDFRGADSRWVGLTGRVRTLVYNTDLVRASDLPGSVLDLTQPAYRGKVAIAPSNASLQDFVSALRELIGEDEAKAWLAGMAANDAEEYANNTAIVEAVARGEIETGLVNHYYIARAKHEDPDSPIATHYFRAGDAGRLLLLSAAGVLDSTDKTVEAKRFLEFLLEPEAQKFFAEETYEYPLAEGAEPVAGLESLAAVDPTTLDLQRLGGDLQTTIELIEASGLGD